MQLVGFNYLCAPAYIYFVISTMFLIISVIFINNGTIETNNFCINPDANCTSPNFAFIILFKVLFIIFWTWVLNFICRTGRPDIAWFLFLFPFIIIIIGFYIILEMVRAANNQNKK